MSRDLLAAHEAGRVEVAIGRASDYFGPRGGAQSNLGDRVFPAALAGRTATVLGDPDQPHTYTFIPDIGEGLAVLGEHPDATGRAWHLPNDPVTRTTRELVDLAFRLAGQPRTRLRQVHPLLLRALAITNPTVREILEMQYQFEEPFIVDSTTFTTRLGMSATPLERRPRADPCHLPQRHPMIQRAVAVPGDRAVEDHASVTVEGLRASGAAAQGECPRRQPAGLTRGIREVHLARTASGTRRPRQPSGGAAVPMPSSRATPQRLVGSRLASGRTHVVSRPPTVCTSQRSAFGPKTASKVRMPTRATGR